MGRDHAGTDRRLDGLASLGHRRGRLVQLAYRFVWNRSDAEDAVQNALAVVHDKRAQLRDPSKLWSWACRIVVRQCLLLRRNEARRAEVHRASSQASATERCASEDRVASNERAAVVRWAVDQLPQQQRTAITLRHLEEMSYARIAQIMELSPSTVRVHVKAAREAMRDAIVNRHPEYFVAKEDQRSEQT